MMRSTTLNDYQLEMKERARAARWERREAMVSTLMLVLVFLGLSFLLVKNRSFFLTMSEPRWDNLQIADTNTVHNNE